MPSPTVIFDIDGTLVDNSWFHTVAWFRACRAQGLEHTMAELHHLVGMGEDQYIDALLGREQPTLGEAHNTAMEPFQAEVPVLAGAGDLLREIHRRGGAVVVATSSGRKSAEEMLSRVLGDTSLLAHVVTQEDVEATKPAPDLAAVALERAGVTADHAVFVGDTGWDIQASGRAGIRCIGVRTGGWTEADLREAGAVAVYENVGALLEGLDASPIGALLRGRDLPGRPAPPDS